MTTFFVQGRPVPQGSKRHVGRGILIEQSNVKPWRTAVAWEAQQACPEILRGPVALTLEFRFKRPKYHYGTGRNAGKVKPRYVDAGHIAPPDVDKCVRAVNDALTGVAFHDDSQVTYLLATKVFTETYEGVMVTVM